MSILLFIVALSLTACAGSLELENGLEKRNALDQDLDETVGGPGDEEPESEDESHQRSDDGFTDQVGRRWTDIGPEGLPGRVRYPDGREEDVEFNSCRCPHGSGQEKVYVCHVPPGNPENERTLCIAVPAVEAHLMMGSRPGPCESATGP